MGGPARVRHRFHRRSRRRGLRGRKRRDVHPKLAELDARELARIELAITKLKQGTFGLCEGCGEKINVARLNALPYTVYCIECQREAERDPTWSDERHNANWEKVYDSAARLDEPRRDIKLSDIEMDLSR